MRRGYDRSLLITQRDLQRSACVRACVWRYMFGNIQSLTFACSRVPAAGRSVGRSLGGCIDREWTTRRRRRAAGRPRTDYWRHRRHRDVAAAATDWPLTTPTPTASLTDWASVRTSLGLLRQPAATGSSPASATPTGCRCLSARL